MKSRIHFTLTFKPWTRFERIRLAICGVIGRAGLPLQWAVNIHPKRDVVGFRIERNRDWDMSQWLAAVVYQAISDFRHKISKARA